MINRCYFMPYNGKDCRLPCASLPKRLFIMELDCQLVWGELCDGTEGKRDHEEHGGGKTLRKDRRKG